VAAATLHWQKTPGGALPFLWDAVDACLTIGPQLRWHRCDRRLQRRTWV